MISIGHRIGHIIPFKSLKQGDSLSLYIFLYCAEELSHLINNSTIEDFSILRYGPSIKHLLLTNGSIVLSKATMIGSCKIHQVRVSSGDLQQVYNFLRPLTLYTVV